MKLIIDIPDRIHYGIEKGITVNGSQASQILIDAVKCGTPLPKGHGDLIDRSKLLVELECGIRSGNYEEGYEKYPHINDMDDCFDTVKYADTIIKQNYY